MKKLSKKRKAGLGLYCLFAVSLAGSICGTFAWYTYGTRIPVYYNGVSIGDSGSLEIGLVAHKKLAKSDAEKYALEEEIINDKIIYWSIGSFQADPLKLIQKTNGYANEFTHPVTAGVYDAEHTEFRLRNCPTNGERFLGGEKWAPPRDYNRLEFAFRHKASGGQHIDENGNVIIDEDVYSDDYTVLLSSCTALSNTNVHEALRIYADAYSGGYLVNPNEDYSTTLISGGRLNMGRDAYYDVEKFNLDSYREFAYGEWEDFNLVYKDEPYPDLPKEEWLPNPKDPMTFTAEPTPGSYGIDYTKSTFPTIQFLGKEIFRSEDVELAVPDPEYDNIAFCDIYIYLEGWDLALDNNEALNDFSFQLQFEAH